MAEPNSVIQFPGNPNKKLSNAESVLLEGHNKAENRVHQHYSALEDAFDKAYHLDSVEIAKKKGWHVKSFEDLTGAQLKALGSEIADAAVTRHKVDHVHNHFLNKDAFKKRDPEQLEELTDHMYKVLYGKVALVGEGKQKEVGQDYFRSLFASAIATGDGKTLNTAGLKTMMKQTKVFDQMVDKAYFDFGKGLDYQKDTVDVLKISGIDNIVSTNRIGDKQTFQEILDIAKDRYLQGDNYSVQQTVDSMIQNQHHLISDATFKNIADREKAEAKKQYDLQRTGT